MTTRWESLCKGDEISLSIIVLDSICSAVNGITTKTLVFYYTNMSHTLVNCTTCCDWILGDASEIDRFAEHC